MPPAWAQTPELGLSDLVNQGSDYAQRELRNRGFVLIQADPRGEKLWQTWWHGRDQVCVRVAHVDGRASIIIIIIIIIIDVSATDSPGHGVRRTHPVAQSYRRGQLPLTPAGVARADRQLMEES
jgi:hypothetical protein